MTKRQTAGTAPRTVNLDLIALRNVLMRAIDEGLLKSLPMENLRPLKVDRRKQKLMTQQEMENIFAAAASLPISGEQLADVLKLMAACGSRTSFGSKK
jgi:site-specific recombinase XerD